MCRNLRIDFVTPPFAGHLYPALDLARRLRDRGLSQIRILTTAGGCPPTQAAGFPFLEILCGHDQDVWAIANTPIQVGSSPLRMWQQLRRNLALMGLLQQQLLAEWRQNPPDLVIADFVVPVAGLTARSLGIPWWTGMPSPCVIETPDGIPAYMGGWQPWPGWIGRGRNWIGRTLVRAVKKTLSRIVSSPLRQLGIDRIYRQDGTETVYSPERILAYGMREFEFEQSWPEHFHFVGPLIIAPRQPGPEIRWMPGRTHVLVTLGTHLLWAKSRAIELLEHVARLMPDTVFHFSRGRMGSNGADFRDNLHLYDSVPYNDVMPRYDAAIIHGGTGVLYTCIEHGVPMLVWPHDYDQFDHAARIVYHGLGRKLVPRPPQIERDLQTLMTSPSIRATLDRFQQAYHSYDAGQAVYDALLQLRQPLPSGG